MKYGDEEPNRVQMNAVNPKTNTLHFILGGRDENRYPAFNGLFTRVSYSHEVGAFVDSVAELKAYLEKQGKRPSELLPSLSTFKVVEDIKQIAFSEKNVQPKTYGGKADSFPHEYSISGWFRFKPFPQQRPWHLAFRVTINNQRDLRNVGRLGDRDLSLWVGKPAGGILHFTTYSYANMNGAGRVNFPQNVRHLGRHRRWHFVYFGYSKVESKAYAYVKFYDKEETKVWNKINHYYAEKYYLYAGKDQYYQAYNGEIANLNFNLGQGAFRSASDFAHP